MRYPAYPQELLDNIIDHLHSDLITLKSCSLVCRTFLPSSRIHLFSCIRLIPPEYSAAQTKPPMTYCQGFYGFLSGSPHIAPYVRELQVVEGFKSPEFRSDKGTRFWIATERTLPLLLGMLKNITRIAFKTPQFSIHWPSLSFDLRESVHIVCRSPLLTHLELKFYAFPTPSDFFKLLSSCPALKHLGLFGIGILGIDNPVHEPIGYFPANSGRIQQAQLDSLDISCFLKMSAFLLDWMFSARSTIDVNKARILSINIAEADDFADARKLLQATTATLEHLTLIPPVNLYGRRQPFPHQLPVHSCLDIGSSPAIRSISLQVNFETGGEGDDLDIDPLPWLKDIFAQIRSPNYLEKITIKLYIEQQDPVSAFDVDGWKAIDAVLSRLDALLEVNFLIYQENGGHGIFSTKLGDALSALGARDMLHVEELPDASMFY